MYLGGWYEERGEGGGGRKFCCTSTCRSRDTLISGGIEGLLRTKRTTLEGRHTVLKGLSSLGYMIQTWQKSFLSHQSHP